MSSTKDLLRRIVQSAHRASNRDGSIGPRDWAYQLVPTDLIEEAEQTLNSTHKAAPDQREP